jgi:hypothetical protein
MYCRQACALYGVWYVLYWTYRNFVEYGVILILEDGNLP